MAVRACSNTASRLRGSSSTPSSYLPQRSQMENLAIARIFSEIADLLEIKSENPFKIRAYRNAADTVAHATDRLSACSDEQLRTMPGIGKELAAKIREISETGGAKYHRDLL